MLCNQCASLSGESRHTPFPPAISQYTRALLGWHSDSISFRPLQFLGPKSDTPGLSSVGFTFDLSQSLWFWTLLSSVNGDCAFSCCRCPPTAYPRAAHRLCLVYRHHQHWPFLGHQPLWLLASLSSVALLTSCIHVHHQNLAPTCFFQGFPRWCVDSFLFHFVFTHFLLCDQMFDVFTCVFIDLSN